MRALQRLPSTLTERESAAVEELTTRLMNKLLHIPMLRLKDAAAEGQGHVYTEAIRYLFDLKEQPDETHNHWDTSQQTGNDTDAMGDRASATARTNARDHYRANTRNGGGRNSAPGNAAWWGWWLCDGARGRALGRSYWHCGSQPRRFADYSTRRAARRLHW